MAESTPIYKKKKIWSQLVSKFVLFSTCITFVSCQNQSTSVPDTINSASQQSTKVLVIGDISDNPAKKIARYQPMADYLANHLNEFGIGRGEVKVAADIETMIDWLKSGQVDIYFDSPYPAMIVCDRAEAKPILRRWKNSQAEYYGILFAMKRSKIETLADLQGKTIAFDKNFSTSGYFLPVVKLIEAGLQTVEINSSNRIIPADQIGYVFSDDDENTIQWVIDGKVEAGAVDIGTFRKIPAASLTEINILAETEKVPRQMVMIRKDLEPKLVATIKSILLKIDQTEEGKEVLNKFEKTAKFDDFPPEKSIDKIRQLYELIPNK